MINPETLAKGPYSSEEEKPPTTMSGDEFAKRTKEIVQRAVDYINKRFRFPQNIFYKQHLLKIEGGKEKLEIIDYDEEVKEDVRYEISPNDAQSALFDVMKEYGLGNPNDEMLSSQPGYSEKSIRERQYYPSNKVRGLFFIRERQYYADSGQTFEVEWFVEPKVSAFKFPPF